MERIQEKFMREGGGGDTVSNWPQRRTTLAARRGTADLHCTPDIQVSGEVCKA